MAGPSYAKEVGLAVAPKIAVWGVGIIAGYILVVRPILRATGVIKSSEEKQQDKQEENFSVSPDSPFNPNYYKSKPGALLVTKAIAQQIAEKIHDAGGWFNDNEEQVYGALRQLKAKTQLSWVADNFYTLYGEDMYQYMRSFLDDSEMQIVNGLANNMV